MLNELETFAKIAPLGTMLIALCAVLIALRQLKTVRQNEAKRQYSQFLLNSADSRIDPNFLIGMMPSDTKSSEYRRYKWYLASYLFAAEEVLESYPDDPYWASTISGALKLHKTALSTIDQTCYSPLLQKMIRRVIASFNESETVSA